MRQLDFNNPSDKYDIPMAIAILHVPVADIAVRNNLIVDHFGDDGQGASTGFGVRLESGLWVMLEQHQAAASGTTIWVGATPSENVDSLLLEVLTALNLSEADIDSRLVNGKYDWE